MTGSVASAGSAAACTDSTCCHSRRPPQPHGLCDPDGRLFARSYTLHAGWPFAGFQLVMEMEPGTCDLYARRARGTCCELETEKGGRLVEAHVRHALVSLLGGKGCHLRSGSRACRAVDLGANNGWFSLMMMQLGAKVVSVEPQTDLARALQDSAQLNCWAGRSRVINALACTRSDFACHAARIDARDCEVGGWRFGNMYGSSQLTAAHRRGMNSSQPKKDSGCAAAHGLPEWVGAVNLSSVLFEHARAGDAPGGAAEIDFIKMDADGPEGGWLRELDEEITAGRLRVEAIVVEGSNLSPIVMQRFQRVHGYTFFRLDEHDGRRHITPAGWDLLSPHGTIARIDRYAKEHEHADALIGKYSVGRADRARASSTESALKPAGDGVSRLMLEDEMWSVRAMRHVFRLKANLSLQHWVTVLNPVIPKGWPPQWAMTLEPRVLEENAPFAAGASVQPEWVHAAKHEGGIRRIVGGLEVVPASSSTGTAGSAGPRRAAPPPGGAPAESGGPG